ncbi:MAG: thiopurine S-methyltransferase [Gammaproteobacteria bacterium]|nr:MAG: thiopurine S-methyltransferase [Gammaproteobacteria bacterium]
MKAEFWHEKWERNEIGFHQTEINPYLTKYWKKLKIPEHKAVFVPLCGKSLDMIWLHEMGHHVIGIELNRGAVESFFAECGLQPEVTEEGNLTQFWAPGYTLYCGDFFDLTADAMQDVGAVYDRAALIAMSHSSRPRYVEHLLSILPAGSPILLVTMEYDQNEMNGPPFSVSQEEVAHLFADHYSVRLLEENDILEENPVFIERGLSHLTERCSWIKPF